MGNIENVGMPVDNFIKIKDNPSHLVFGNRAKKGIEKTICIPVYGVGKYIYETLKNLKGIVDDKTQIIISNNSANHYDDAIFKKMCVELDLQSVLYFQTDNVLGMFNNFNRCIELVQTDYFAFLHDDDLLNGDFNKYFDIALKYLRVHSSIGMLHENFIIFKGMPMYKTNNQYTVYEINESLITHMGYSCTSIPSCGMIIKKQAALEAGGFNDDFPNSGDAFLSIAMMNKGFQIYQANCVTGYYRIDENTSTKLQVCQGFIMEDTMFRQSWATKGLLKKISMAFFEKYLYSKSIDVKIDSFTSQNPEINVKNLDFKKCYKRYSKYSIQNVIFKVINKIIWITRKNVDMEEI